MTLDNYVNTLQKAFKTIQSLDGKSVILCLGYTGCGKSTMLNSLLHGSDKLVSKNIEEEKIINLTGKEPIKRKFKRKIIDLKD